jgi:hypothetical protein
VSTPPPHRFAAFGFIGAVAATIVGAPLSPEYSPTAIRLFARAIAYLLLVFAAAASATYLGFLVTGEGRTLRAKEVAVRTAATTLWLPPLLMFSGQRSWFGLVIWALLLFEVARLIAFLRGRPYDRPALLPETPSDGHMFPVLKQDFPYGLSILGALMIQGAIFGAVGGHDLLAGLLYFLGTVAIAYRSVKMFQDLPALNHARLRHRIPSVLSIVTFLIVFAWLPRVVGSGGLGFRASSAAAASGLGRSIESMPANGDGSRRGTPIGPGSATLLARLRALFVSGGWESQGDSFSLAKRILGSRFTQSLDGTNTGLSSRTNTKIASSVFVAGPVFPGVELYPEIEPHKKLVAPALSGARGGGADDSDPLSIPFDGVYRFWRGPSERPPANSVVMHGSPAARFFRSTDGDGMSMEARQNLGFSVDLKRYGAIEIAVENADPFPHTVSILLKIRNTTLAEKPSLSLGMEDVSTPAASAGSAGGRQTLRFPIPTAPTVGSFDELTVSYYLRGARSNRSARIAIERFRLVPRGG